MEVQVRKENGIGIIQTEGYINTEGGEKILEECKKLIEEGTSRIVVNLEKSNLINSTGIMCLLEASDAAKDAGGGICFCCATPTMEKTFGIMGVTAVAKVVGSEDEATGMVGK
jgi:anti-sigma B factor antagonist